MTTREVTAIALKILSIWLLLQLFLSLPKLAGIYYQFGEEISLAHELGIITGFILVGLFMVFVLWKFANSVLRDTSPEQSTAMSSESLAIQLLGCYLAVIALGEIPLALLYTYTGTEAELNKYAYLLGRIIQLAFGFSLIVKLSYWQSILQEMRRRG